MLTLCRAHRLTAEMVNPSAELSEVGMTSCSGIATGNLQAFFFFFGLQGFPGTPADLETSM